MSSFSKTGLARKAGKTVLGIALLSSLALTACSAPAPTGDGGKADSSSSASAPASAAPQFDGFQSEAFDLGKQVSVSISDLNISTKREAIFLGSGVVGQKQDGDKTSVVFIPYEDADKAWTYTPDAPGHIITNLMRWKGKSYIVVVETVKESKPATGMQAAQDTETDNVVVLDASTGKVVNKFEGKPSVIGQSSQGTGNYYLDNIVRKDASPRDKEFIRPFMVGLVFATWEGAGKLVDPVTGDTVATDNQMFSKPNNEAGFIASMDKIDYVTSEETLMKGIFGNYALLEISNPSKDANNGGRAYFTFSLVNTVTGETVSNPMKCASAGYGLTNSKDAPVYSPDFRYVKFVGNYVFDTQTGASFCDTPLENKTMRDLPVSALDNEGNMYGLAQRDYLRVSVADPAKADTLLGDVSLSEEELPLVITDKGSAVFWMDESKKTLVTVPAKG
jgi:hypothetical protein